MTRKRDPFRSALTAVLRGGALTAAAIFLVGVGRYASLHTPLPANTPLGEDVATVAFLLDLRAGNPLAICTLGTLVLIVLPIARVALSFCYFVSENDRLYACITGVVLALLLTGALAGKIS